MVDNIRIKEFWKKQEQNVDYFISTAEIEVIIKTILESANKTKTVKSAKEYIL